MTPQVLDLFCCAGGAGMGYHQAGFEVVGVDLDPQPRYPFKFIQADALEVLSDARFVSQFDLIHASPPCQKSCTLNKGTNAARGFEYPDLYEPIRNRLLEIGKPAVIENPDSRPDVVLCGEMFGLGVIRHRKFELVGWTTEQPSHIKHRGYVRGWRHGVWKDGPYIAAYGTGGDKGTVQEMQEAMGIAWTDVRRELTEAIPPAYTQFVGEQIMEKLKELDK